MILRLAVLVQYRRVTHRHTDTHRQTDGHTMMASAERVKIICLVSLNETLVNFCLLVVRPDFVLLYILWS